MIFAAQNLGGGFKYLLFSLFGEDSHFDTYVYHMFQMGWFNHQLALTLMPQPNVSRHVAVFPWGLVVALISLEPTPMVPDKRWCQPEIWDMEEIPHHLHGGPGSSYKWVVTLLKGVIIPFDHL